MKVYAISDLHLSIFSPKPMDIFGEVWSNYLDEISAYWEENIADDDLVLIAGDISWAMTLDAVKPDLNYISGFKGKKVLLRGNHDYWWHSISALRGMLPYGVYAVQNDCLRFGDVLLHVVERVVGRHGLVAGDGVLRAVIGLSLIHI